GAHATGTRYDGHPMGFDSPRGSSEAVAYSFYATKNITTGEGGMVTTNDGDLAARMRILTLHGINKDAWKRYAEGGKWFYQVLEAGFKYNFTDLQAATKLFREALGFHRRNTMRVAQPLADGTTTTLKMDFLGCNPRHHTLGLVGVPLAGQIVHFMLETGDIDDVGRALDRVHDADVPISLTLGKHANDHMVSFYVTSPDGYSVEFGWGGLHVDDVSTETTYEITKPSFWGHRRPTAVKS
ncbi:MAG: DegT/DnrJ/EryC1/StrS family aminotransferase, partial [Actinobacteria bacterium]|nr:DegT/DnrJ/EryC1/StrS family aminotransferase [Actinomycetota bacterium]